MLATETAASPLPESPFQVKGVVFAGTRSYFDSRVEGGYAALLDALPPALREFMEQPFVAGGRYEALLIPDLVEREAAVAGMPLTQYLGERTRWQAERDLTGFYRLLVRIAPAPTIARRVAVVMTQMFNFGRVSIEAEGSRLLNVTIAGVPTALVPWFERCVVVYGEVALRLGGTPGPRCKMLASESAAPIEGYPARDLFMRVTWG